MLKSLILSLIIALLVVSCDVLKTDILKYTIPETPWEAEIKDPNRQKASPDVWPTAPNLLSLGSHRALIRVPESGEVAHLYLEWRRHDKNVDKPRFILINRETRDTVRNIYRVEVNNEHCEILFGPVEKGAYSFYYLPFETHGGWGGYGRDYLPREPSPDAEWISRNGVNETNPPDFIESECMEIQARTEFESFYPMEVIATEEEKEALVASTGETEFLLFPEDRKYPIRMLDNIPQKWILEPMGKTFEGTACRNEYYAFQVGLWAIAGIEDVQVDFSPLKGRKHTLPVTSMTCFNTGGIDHAGNSFTKTVNVPDGRVQPLWIGLDIPADMEPGKYRGKLTIKTKNAGQKEVDLTIKITSELLADRGDGEPWRHSRLRWLNSTLGINDDPVEPWKPLEREGKKLNLSGKELLLDDNGLPASINVYGEEVLAEPVRFIVQTAEGSEQWNVRSHEIIKEGKSGLISETVQESGNMELVTRSEIETDGWMKYYIDIKALKEIDISDIQLKIPYKKENSIFLSGMGHQSGNDVRAVRTPQSHDAKWDHLHDAFWMGSTKGGLYCELRGAAYCGPMLYFGPIRDFYKPTPPDSWYNSDKGGFRIRTAGKAREAIVYSGSRTLKKGEVLRFECAMIITPIKKMDTHERFTNRYYHNQYHPEPTKEDAALGLKVVNLHHANEFNPTINYPYAAQKEMKGYVDRCHEKGMKVKIYYTTRELSNFATEIWAFRSLGDEILTSSTGYGGGYTWLREHFVDHYVPQWYQYFNDPRGADAAILTSVGMTRFFNYYIEDLKWLTKNVGIDGLYLDAASYDRDIVKRIRKAMAEVKPGCLLDLHEGRRSIITYLEFFPYLDKTWLGEGIDYDEIDPVDYLVSVSGIPMGFNNDMLHEGGNPWRGMVYGMSVRHGWTTNGIFCDPTSVWKVWDDFGIEDSRMVGYWDENPVVTTSHKDVLATSYLKDGKMLISIASWAEKPVKVRLNIDFNKTQMDPEKISVTAPPVKDFQPGRTFSLSEPIPVEPTKGWLLILEKN